MLESVLSIPFWLEFAGVLAGGIVGGVAAVQERFDIFGTVCIACVTGIGGGIVRDLLLQDFGIYAFQHPIIIVACVTAGILVFYFYRLMESMDWIFDFLDNLSVGLWAVVSVGKALSAGLGIIPCIILGTVTAVGGGIVRDALMSRPPVSFQAGTPYGIAALAGSAAYALMKQNAFLGSYAAITCVGLVFAIRYLSEIFEWKTKPAVDYSDKVIAPVKKVANAAAMPVRRTVESIKKPKNVQLPSQPHHEKSAHRERLRAAARKKKAESAQNQAENK